MGEIKEQLELPMGVFVVRWKVIAWIALFCWPLFGAIGYLGNAYIEKLGESVLASEACVNATMINYGHDQITGREDITCSRNLKIIPYRPRRQVKKKKGVK